MSYAQSDRTMVGLILATYAKAVGLSRDEATQLQEILFTQALPWSTDMAWTQLDEATQAIRQRRNRGS